MNISEMNTLTSLEELLSEVMSRNKELTGMLDKARGIINDSLGVADALLKDNAKLRRLLAIAYSGAKLYGDNGELQDNSEFPFIDFARDSADEIEAALRARANKRASSFESDRSFAHRWGRQYP